MSGEEIKQQSLEANVSTINDPNNYLNQKLVVNLHTLKLCIKVKVVLNMNWSMFVLLENKRYKDHLASNAYLLSQGIKHFTATYDSDEGECAVAVWQGAT